YSELSLSLLLLIPQALSLLTLLQPLLNLCAKASSCSSARRIRRLLSASASLCFNASFKSFLPETLSPSESELAFMTLKRGLLIDGALVYDGLLVVLLSTVDPGAVQSFETEEALKRGDVFGGSS